MISEGLSGPGGEMLRASQTVGANLSAPLTLPPQKESIKTYIFATEVEVKLQVMKNHRLLAQRSTSPPGPGRDWTARTGG